MRGRGGTALSIASTPSEDTAVLQDSGSQAAVGRFDTRYELVEEIGHGGMGVVYKAIDLELDEVIAIKVLRTEACDRPELIVRFKHEIKVARHLSHPNIARTHDLIELKGRLCVSMEFIEGRPLSAVLADGVMPVPWLLRLLPPILTALDLAHGLGIVHRDLKPANIILDPDDVPRILDFGIAKSRWAPDADAGVLLGTPAYMAPEQWGVDSVVDLRTDLYSLGVMLYQMACGRLPFRSKDLVELMRMHCSARPLPPRSIVSDLPSGLESIILRLLAKEPDRRFARAADVLAELDGALAPSPARSVRARTALVADPDADLRAELCRHLAAERVVTLEAEDGGRALELAVRERPDVVFLQSSLPVLDSLRVVRLIKTNSRTRHIRVIVVGTPEDERCQALRALGASDFLPRPVAGKPSPGLSQVLNRRARQGER